MKKVVSGIIAAAVLSQTAAMASTIISLPYDVTTTRTQTFNGQTTKAKGWSQYSSGSIRVEQETWQHTVDVVKNPFEAPETTDDVLKFERVSDEGEVAVFTMFPSTAMKRGDVFKISFDAALTDKVTDKSNMQLIVNINGGVSKSVFRVFDTGYTNNIGFDDRSDGYIVNSPSGSEFSHYEITFDTGANTITYVSDSGTDTQSMTAGTVIRSIDSFRIRTEHSADSTAGAAYYINNMSYTMTSVTTETAENIAKVETFNNCSENGTWRTTADPVELDNAKYFLKNVERVETAQDIDAYRGKVLKTSGYSESGSYIAVPLNYTLDDDDVFTFSFDYAHNVNNETESLVFKLDDASAAARNMNIKLTRANGPLNGVETLNITNGNLFTIHYGAFWIGDRWETAEQTVFIPNQFSVVTVEIDNSDDEYDNRRTFAIYVDGVLYGSKWYMEDNEGAVDLSTTIKGVSLCFNQGGLTRYFDNLWATVTENEITVDDDVASFAYPVVYDNEEEAVFAVAYFDEYGRFISADTSSATPIEGRFVTADISEPAGTATTKVFRWNNLTDIKPLTSLWQSVSP